MAVHKNLLLFFLLFPNLIFGSQIGAASNSTIEILAEDIIKTSEDTYLVGVKFRLDPGWHTYWINPGDSGEKASFEWKLPEGVKISNPKWPSPEIIPYPPLMTYGYNEEVTVLFNLTVERDLLASEQIFLKSNWLACEDVCLPQSASIETTFLKIDDYKLSNKNSELLEKQKKLPKKLPSSIKVLEEKEEILLTGKVDSKLINTEVYFFPYDQNLINHTAEQKTKFEENSFYHAVEKSKLNNSNSSVKGVITFKDGNILESYYFSTNSFLTSDSLNSLNLMITLFSAFLGGLLLNLMPCVFPVIALKIFNFIEIANNKRQVFLHGLSFSFGSTLSFLLIGIFILFLKILGEEIGWGFQLQSPIFVTLLMYLFVGLFLNFLGVFSFPNFLGNFGMQARTTSYNNSFATGILAVAVATPCTAPFMGSALGLALTQPNFYSILIFFSLGVGFSAPYLTISMFPRILEYLPRPGYWMETFRKVMAIPIFLTVLWLFWILSNQISLDSLIGVLIGILFVIFLCYLEKIINFFKFSKKTLLPVFVAFISGSIFFLPYDYNDEINNNDVTSLKEIEELSRSGPLFINFTADWCITCKVNEQVALNTNYFLETIESENISYLKIDWTNKDSDINRLIESYGRSGIPLYVFYPYEEYGPIILPEILNKSILENYLEKSY